MKRMICLLLSACMLLCLAACGENTGQPPGTESMDTTENQDGDHSHEIRLLTPEKTLHTYYEWEDDYDRALVRSEHSCVTLGQAGDTSGCFQPERGRQRYKDRRDECQPIPACR